jgi:hypothetical protein
LNNLPAGTSQTLLTMIQDAGFFDIPENSNSPAHPCDELHYTITVEAGATSQHGRHTVHTSDTAAPEAQKPLIEALSDMARASLAGR